MHIVLTIVIVFLLIAVITKAIEIWLGTDDDQDN